MLRFIRSHITNSTDYKTEDLTDFFSYSKIATHGFPQRASCVAVDEKLGILAIGTKDGRIQIVGGEGIEWSTTIESGLPIAYIYFAVGSGVLIALCDDSRTNVQSFHRCQIVNDRLSLVRFNYNNELKRIACCAMLNREDGNSALLIGSTTGNVYALWAQNLELIEYLIFSKTSLQRLAELKKDERHISKIVVHPKDTGKVFLLFNNKVVVLYDTLQDECERIFLSSTPITDLFCDALAANLYCATTSGFFTIFYLYRESGDEDKSITSEKKVACFDSVKCTKILKIAGTILYNYVSLIAFTGGLPNELYGDRYALTLQTPEKLLVLDFESPILDFAFLTEGDGIGFALFILCEQELVAIDIQHHNWLPFSLSHFNPLHSSPVTSTAIFSHLSQSAFLRLCTLAERMEKTEIVKRFSPRKWPLKCGLGFSAYNRVKDLNSHEITLLLTGHENGCINIWLTNLLSLKPWISCSSVAEFNCPAANDVDELVEACPLHSIDPEDLPMRKAGLFDSFCDDDRLAIVKLSFDIESAQIIAGGRSGQVLVFEPCDSEDNLPAVQMITVDMTASEADFSFSEGVKPSTSTAYNGACGANASSKFVRNKKTAIPVRCEARSCKDNSGFCLSFNTLTQFLPAVQVTAVAFQSNKALLAAGNEFGYAICSLKTREVLMKNCLLSSQEIVQISNLDGTLSRFKSVKKSIRQSFRRKKRQLNNIESADERTLSIVEECRPTEREIVQRSTISNILGGETLHSLVKVLQIYNCRMGANLALSDYLLAGMHGGVVLVHHILDDKISVRNGSSVNHCINNEAQSAVSHLSVSNSNSKWDARCPLIKEIRLKHGAPLVNIEVNQDLLTSRLLIFTEEQIRAYMLPTLKPSRYKCRFTAIEGSRIRKAKTILLKNYKSTRGNAFERFIGLITNRGEVYVLSLQSPRRVVHVPFTRSSDASGISSAVLSTEGELFYLRAGGSELQRASIAASPNYCAPSPFRDEQFLPLI